VRIGVTSRNPLVWLLEAIGVLPEPLLVGFWGMEASRALIAGTELGIFDALAEKPRTAPDLAADLGYDAIGTEALLNALNGFGYLRRADGQYTLSRRARRWMTSDARFSMVRPMGLYRVLWDEFGDLEDRIRHGGERDFHHPDRDAEFWRRYETGLGAAAALTAPSVAKAIPFAGTPRRVLDVGGGHGAFSAALCRRHEGLRATVLDFEPATVIGRELIAEQGMSDRVEFVAGDLLEAEWGEGFDGVLLFNLLHVFSPKQCEAILAKAHDALAPGGTVAVYDAAHKETGGNINAVGGGSELLFYAINNTRAYPEATMRDWVASAGFADLRSKHPLGMPEVLITGRRA